MIHRLVFSRALNEQAKFKSVKSQFRENGIIMRSSPFNTYWAFALCKKFLKSQFQKRTQIKCSSSSNRTASHLCLFMSFHRFAFWWQAADAVALCDPCCVFVVWISETIRYPRLISSSFFSLFFSPFITRRRRSKTSSVHSVSYSNKAAAMPNKRHVCVARHKHRRQNLASMQDCCINIVWIT